MKWRQPKNTDKYYWTAHVAEKMHYYGLSEQKVLGVIRRPKRIETGIATDTVAAMIPVGEKSSAQIEAAKNKAKKSAFGNYGGDKKWNQEIWVMYQLRGSEAISKSQFPLAANESRLGQAISKQDDKAVKKLHSQFEKFGTSEKTKKLMKLMPKKLVIISAWRFPGVSSEKDPIPAEIWREIEEMGIV